MAIDITHAEDLRKVYNLAVEQGQIGHPSEVVSAFGPAINSRYARELVGALTTGHMLTLIEDPEESTEAWIPTEGADIDKWLGTKPKPKSSTRRGTADNGNTYTAHGEPCLCGCGEATGKANYRPGHDARHAGQVGREIAANINTKGFDRRTLLAALPSDLLKAKAEKVAETVTAKASKPKAEKPEPVADVEGTVKVGKTEYVAKRGPAGTVLYLDLKGNWQPASKTAAKTFSEG